MRKTSVSAEVIAVSWIGINEARLRVPASQLRLLLIRIGLGLQYLLQEPAVGDIAARRAG